MRGLTVLIAGMLLLASSPANAARVSTEYLVDRLVSEYIVPRYAALSAAADAQEDVWGQFCVRPMPAGFEAARQAYRRTADAWSEIELIRYGPISEEFRVDRLNYWPERKNATARALKALLGKEGTSDLGPGAFAENSVAVQGLPALERLLFDGENPAAAFLDGSGAAKRSCAVGQAIAANIARIVRHVLADWTAGPDSLAARLEDPALAKEAAGRLATDLVSLFTIIRDIKLEPVLGRDAASARPKSAEAWRSGRSARALALNLEAALAVTRIIMEGQDEEVPTLVHMLDSARSIAESLPSDLGALAASPKDRGQLVLLLDAVTFARDRALADIPAALGVTVGFNSLDGD
jgi:predicted lipoprotein